jgi:hypothetical protein
MLGDRCGQEIERGVTSSPSTLAAS